MALVDKDATLKARFDILVSIPGVSRVTAFTLLIEMPELGELDEKAAAALSGLAPMSRQSGRWTGRAVIAGGRAIVRQALYMPALVASGRQRLTFTNRKGRGLSRPPPHALPPVPVHPWSRPKRLEGMIVQRDRKASGQPLRGRLLPFHQKQLVSHLGEGQGNFLRIPALPYALGNMGPHRASHPEIVLQGTCFLCKDRRCFSLV